MTVRVRRARRSGRLACGHWVNVGHLIVSHGKSWRCTECARAREPAGAVAARRDQEGGGQ